MDRKVKSFRLRVDLLDRLKGCASERGSSEVSVMEAALVSFFDDSAAGVPDLDVTSEVPDDPALTRAEQVAAAMVAAAGQVRPARELMERVAMDRQALLNQQAARARAADGHRGRRS